MYDIKCFSKNLKLLRTERWKLYKDNPNTEDYQKYSCCKTEESFASEMNVDRRTIGKWENGKSFPSTENLIEICNILDCNIDYFFGISDVSELDPIILASHNSGISIDIIKMSLKDSHYRDFLNYFMNPNNSKTLIETIETTACAEHLMKNELSNTGIKEETLNDLKIFFNEFCSTTTLDKINIEEYQKYLTIKFPIFENNNNKKLKKKIKIQNHSKILCCESLDENYNRLIKHLATETYEIFKRNIFINYKKEKMKSDFLEMYENYVSDL